MLRTQSQFFEYSKGNFIPVERETALELAKQREAEKQAQTPEAAVKEEQKNLREMKEQVEQGKSLSYGQVKQMETYKQRYVAPASAQLMVAEGKDVVLAEIGAYDAKKLKKPYITKRGANGRFSFVSDAAVGEFVGGSEGGKIIVRNVKDGDVFTYGQARNDGEKQASTYAVIQNGQAISMVREEYEGWKAENSGKKNPTERAKQVNLIEATQELAAKGMSGADLQKALLGKENIKEFAGKTAAQKNQLAGNAVKAVETMSQPKSMGR
jgi:alkylated DNA nucleotide flippase Atl1